MIRCVLFDLDGVLVEACDWHFCAFNSALKEVSGTEISHEEHIGIFNGLPTAKKLDLLILNGRVKEGDRDKIWKLKQTFTIDTIKSMGSIDWAKIQLMNFLKNNDIKIACVTNSIRETAELMLNVTGQLEFMDLLISNEDVIYPKPAAEGYIKAMVKLGFEPHETLIVEDSEYGIRAATNSCANVMKVNCCADVTRESVEHTLEKYGF